MSDYLTRLAERTLGRAVAVRPSLAPLFSDAAFPIEEPPPPEDAHGTPSAAPSAARPDAPPLAVPLAGSAPQSPRSLDAPPPARFATSDVSTEARPTHFHEDAPPPLVRPTAPGDRLPTSIADDITPESPSRIASRRQVEPMPVASQETRPVHQHEASATDPRPAPPPLVPASAARGQAPVDGPLAGQRLPVSQPAGTRWGRAPEATPPAVRISIGRIDVRATPAGRASRGERSRATEVKAGGLSLGEYLAAGRTRGGASS